MRIEELHVKGFGKWQDALFRFAPGINLFEAPNEAGKSTLLQAIFAALYGMKRDYVKTTRYLPEYEKYRPWHLGEYETIITYTLAGKTYRLHRTLHKEREQTRLFLLPDWTELTDVYHEDRRKERDFLERHLGLTRTMFTDVTWIKREPLSASEHLLPALKGDAEADDATPVVRQLLEELEREAGAIGVKERAENTLLGKAASLAAQKEQELMQAQSMWQEVAQLTRQIADWEAQKSAGEQRKMRVQRKKELAVQREAAWQERWRRSYVLPDEQGWAWWMETAASEAERALHERSKAAITDALKEPNPALHDREQEIQAQWEKVNADYQRGLQIRREWENAHFQLAQAAVSQAATGGRRSQRSRARKSYTTWFFAIACLFAGMGAISLMFAEWTNGAVACALAVLSALIALAARRRQSGARTKERGLSEWETLHGETERLGDQLAQLLQVWGVADWDSFLQMREKLREEHHANELAKSAVQAGSQERADAILRDWGERLRECLNEERPQWEQELQASEDELQQAEQEFQHLREQIARAQGQLEARDGVSLAKAQSEYDAAVREVRELQMRREALRLAGDTLREAAATWNRDISAAVSDTASQVMTQLSGGVYQQIRLDPREGFRIRLLEPKTRQVLEQEQFSTGTQDQLYFAQRIALFTHFSEQTEPLPLFLDDHFVHYDQQRLEQALDYVAMLSEQHQIFLFTCMQREGAYLQPLLSSANRHALHRLALSR